MDSKILIICALLCTISYVKGSFKLSSTLKKRIIKGDRSGSKKLDTECDCVGPQTGECFDYCWDLFCDEACAEGKAGPECDCAEHPIGKREGDRSGSKKLDTECDCVGPQTGECFDYCWDLFCDEACAEGKAGPECDCAEHPIGKREGDRSGSKKPNIECDCVGHQTGECFDYCWDLFCDEACAEGKAGPECDCAEHPIGKREGLLSNTMKKPLRKRIILGPLKQKKSLLWKRFSSARN